MNKRRKKQGIDLDPVTVEGPTVQLDEPAKARDEVSIGFSLRPYRHKRLVLLVNTLKLKNAIVAYIDSTPLHIRECVDYFYRNDIVENRDIGKSIGAAVGRRGSCAILVDENGDYHVCLLDAAFTFADVARDVDPALESSGTTDIESMGNRFAGNCRIAALVTSDGVALVPVQDDRPILDGNAHYCFADLSPSDWRIAALLSALKSRPLESGIRMPGEERWS